MVFIIFHILVFFYNAKVSVSEIALINTMPSTLWFRSQNNVKGTLSVVLQVSRSTGEILGMVRLFRWKFAIQGQGHCLYDLTEDLISSLTLTTHDRHNGRLTKNNSFKWLNWCQGQCNNCYHTQISLNSIYFQIGIYTWPHTSIQIHGKWVRKQVT